MTPSHCNTWLDYLRADRICYNKWSAADVRRGDSTIIIGSEDVLRWTNLHCSDNLNGFDWFVTNYRYGRPHQSATSNWPQRRQSSEMELKSMLVCSKCQSSFEVRCSLSVAACKWSVGLPTLKKGNGMYGNRLKYFAYFQNASSNVSAVALCFAAYDLRSRGAIFNALNYLDYREWSAQTSIYTWHL